MRRLTERITQHPHSVRRTKATKNPFIRENSEVLFLKPLSLPVSVTMMRTLWMAVFL